MFEVGRSDYIFNQFFIYSLHLNSTPEPWLCTAERCVYRAPDSVPWHGELLEGKLLPWSINWGVWGFDNWIYGAWIYNMCFAIMVSFLSKIHQLEDHQLSLQRMAHHQHHHHWNLRGGWPVIFLILLANKTAEISITRAMQLVAMSSIFFHHFGSDNEDIWMVATVFQ